MHPDITKTIAALRVDEKHAAATAARQARARRSLRTLWLMHISWAPPAGRPGRRACPSERGALRA